jgi:hypothetical protein
LFAVDSQKVPGAGVTLACVAIFAARPEPCKYALTCSKRDASVGLCVPQARVELATQGF